MIMSKDKNNKIATPHNVLNNYHPPRYQIKILSVYKQFNGVVGDKPKVGQ